MKVKRKSAANFKKTICENFLSLRYVRIFACWSEIAFLVAGTVIIFFYRDTNNDKVYKIVQLHFIYVRSCVPIEKQYAVTVCLYASKARLNCYKFIT